MAKPNAAAGTQTKRGIPKGLIMFCYALMGAACAINGAFIAVASPVMAPYGLEGLVVAGLIGAVVGIVPALWLAREIHDGLSRH